MPQTTGTSGTGARRRRPFVVRQLGLALALSMLSILMAACSGGSAGPGVARASSSPSSPSQGGALAFAVCMRSQGLPNFPDPGGAIPSGLDKNSPQFQAAQRACGSLLPQGTGAQPSAADKERFLHFSACVRAHGIPNYPNPVFPAQGGATIGLPPGMDDSNPLLQAAEKACAQYLPGGGPTQGSSPHNGGGSP